MRGTASICGKCYAATMEKRFPTLRKHLVRNGELLSAGPLTDRQIPVILDRHFRFHSLGELINDQHLLNFLAITNKNPETTFTLWSKRKQMVAGVFDVVDKPPNLILIYSTPALNLSSTPVPPKYFDKTFSVHTKDNRDVEINCFRKCRECLVCYTPNNISAINEVLK